MTEAGRLKAIKVSGWLTLTGKNPGRHFSLARVGGASLAGAADGLGASWQRKGYRAFTELKEEK
jgi:hypothetical protein